MRARGRARAALGLVVWLAPRGALAKEEGHLASALQHSGGVLPPFFDYDCDLAATSRTAATDWNDVHARVAARVADIDRPDFGMHEELRHLVEGPLAESAMDECPLGVLYLTILAFYEARELGREEETLLSMADAVQSLLTAFTVYAVALSRWPVFYALKHFSTRYEPQPEYFCDDQGGSGLLNWVELRSEANQWATLAWQGEDHEAIDKLMAEKFLTVLRNPYNHALAQDECEYGFYFLAVNQLLSAAHRETYNMPPFQKLVDLVIGNSPFIRVSSSGWPIFEVLVIFSDMNKGMWFFGGGDRKYLRGFGDWNLRRDELSPLLPASLGFLSPAWRAAAAGAVASLLARSGAGFAEEVRRLARRREDADGPLRPIVRTLVDAALAIAAAQSPQQRRLAYVVFLYGARWSRLLPRLAARLRQLGAERPLLAISIGADAAAACRGLAAGGRAGPASTVCWVPDTQSQVHRFTAIHALLHLGIDAIYLDMDTFLIRDPTPRILSQAEGFDALFSRHADGDCVNIGVFYLRSTPETAVWLSQFLAWYHDHPFEIDQRGLQVFLRLPSERVQIAYPPADLVGIRAGVLDDVNEFVIGVSGWHGAHERLLILHWCEKPIEQKEEEIWAAYDAADAAAAHGMALAPALLAASPARGGRGSWARVQHLRAIVDSYRVAAPPRRTACW